MLLPWISVSLVGSLSLADHAEVVVSVTHPVESRWTRLPRSLSGILPKVDYLSYWVVLLLLL